MIEILLLSIVTLIGAFLQTVVGFGFVFFLAPVLLIYFPPSVSVTTSLIVASALNLLILYGEDRQREYSRSIIVSLTVSALPGLVIGALIVTVIHKELLQVILGILVIAGAMIQKYLAPNPVTPPKPSFTSVLAGFCAGILNTSTSLGGPPLVIWLRSHKINRNQIRDTLAMIFLTMNIAGIGIIYTLKHSSLTLRGVYVAALLIPLTVIGHQVGRRTVKRVSDRHYSQVIFWTVIAAGFISLVLGLSQF